MSKSVTLTMPTAKTVNGARAELESAGLLTIATAAGVAAATLKSMATTASALKGSISRNVLRVVSKEAITDVIVPLRETCANAGSSVSQLSTIRTAVIKMMVAYGVDGAPAEDGAVTRSYGATPLWDSIAEAKESGDAAVTAAVSACITYAGEVNGVPVNPSINEAARDGMLARIGEAAQAFALSEDSAGKIRGVYFAALAAVVEAAEAATAEALEDDSAKQDAEIEAASRAQEIVEMQTLREIMAEAVRVLGVVATDPASILAEMKTYAAAEVETA